MKHPILIALLVAGLVASGTSAAQAADDDTVVYTDTYSETQEDVSAYFTLVDPATLDETVLTANPYLTGDEGIWLTGIDIYGGTGYAIRGLDGGAKDVFTWNITTGAQTAPIPLTYTDAGFFGEEVDFIETWALDATTDGRILAIGFFDAGGVDGEGYHHAVIEVDPATGVITPIVDLTAAITSGTYWYEGIATNPATGTTYLLGYHYESEAANQYPAVATPVDLDANTVGSPIILTAYPSNVIDDINEGDFDDAGILFLLSDDGVLGALASPLSSSSAFANLGSPAQLANNVIAVTGATTLGDDDDEALASTGPDTATLAFAGFGALGALALGALTLVWTARRRSRA